MVSEDIVIFFYVVIFVIWLIMLPSSKMCFVHKICTKYGSFYGRCLIKWGSLGVKASKNNTHSHPLPPPTHFAIVSLLCTGYRINLFFRVEKVKSIYFRWKMVDGPHEKRRLLQLGNPGENIR